MVYEGADVMSENLRSQPGRGILSPPMPADQWVIMDDENGNWPAGQAKYLQVQRPSNSHSTLKIQILDGENVLTGVSRKSINSPTNGMYRVPIRAGLIPDNVDEITVRLGGEMLLLQLSELFDPTTRLGIRFVVRFT